MKRSGANQQLVFAIVLFAVAVLVTQTYDQVSYSPILGKSGGESLQQQPGIGGAGGELSGSCPRKAREGDIDTEGRSDYWKITEPKVFDLNEQSEKRRLMQYCADLNNGVGTITAPPGNIYGNSNDYYLDAQEDAETKCVTRLNNILSAPGFDNSCSGTCPSQDTEIENCRRTSLEIRTQWMNTPAGISAPKGSEGCFAYVEAKYHAHYLVECFPGEQ